MRQSYYDMSHREREGRKAEMRSSKLFREHNRLKEMTKELIISNGLEVSEELRKAVGLRKNNKDWQEMRRIFS